MTARLFPSLPRRPSDKNKDSTIQTAVSFFPLLFLFFSFCTCQNCKVRFFHALKKSAWIARRPNWRCLFSRHERWIGAVDGKKFENAREGRLYVHCHCHCHFAPPRGVRLVVIIRLAIEWRDSGRRLISTFYPSYRLVSAQLSRYECRVPWYFSCGQQTHSTALQNNKTVCQQGINFSTFFALFFKLCSLFKNCKKR